MTTPVLIPSDERIVNLFTGVAAVIGRYDPDDCIAHTIAFLTPNDADDETREAISAAVHRVWNENERALCQEADTPRAKHVPAPFSPGDRVLHRPSGEAWIVLRSGTDGIGGFVEPAGWPPCRARASDCTLVESAADRIAAGKWVPADEERNAK